MTKFVYDLPNVVTANQAGIIDYLKNNKNAYPHSLSEINLKETHISWVLLTGKFAYKIKKDVKFGNILNFSTLALRKKYCFKEVAINKELCGDMYLGVVKIVPENNSGYKIVPENIGKGALEYAVKMVEIQQKFRMDRLLIANKIYPSMIERIAKKLWDFHESTKTSNKIKQQGTPESLRKKIHEDFITISKLTKLDPVYREKLLSFVKKNQGLLMKRVKENKIKDLHGDLYLKNIFITKKKLYMYDRIEFNDLLRYGDVSEDVAFLCMDLDFLGRRDLSNQFIKSYLNYSNDEDMEKLLPFYLSHKACIRAKVNFFRAKNSENLILKKDHFITAEKFLKLAQTYFTFF